MGVDCTAAAGIGIDFNRATLEKFGLGELWEKFDETDDEWEFLEKLLDGKGNVSYGASGSYFSGDLYYHLFAKDNIWGVMDFISDLRMIGFNGIDKTNLKFIEEVIWS